jgi:hypothetical protein
MAGILGGMTPGDTQLFTERFEITLYPNTTNRFGSSLRTCVTGTCTLSNSPHASTQLIKPCNVCPALTC